jgi:hypothetical protein
MTFVLWVLIAGTTGMSASDPIAQKEFRGCGSTEVSARASLAANIAIDVRSAFEDRESEQHGASGEGSSTLVRSSISQHSEVPLVDVRIERKDGEVCAIQTADQLESALSVRLDRIPGCDAGLPNDDHAKSVALTQCLEDIHEARALSPLFWRQLTDSQHRVLSDLDRQEAQIEALNAKLVLQSIRFDVSLNGARARIGAEVLPLQHAIPRPAGSMHYVIEAPGYCPQEGTIDLARGESRVVAPNWTGQELPRLKFEPNDPTALVRIDGQPWPLGRVFISARCTGSAAYEGTLPGAEPIAGDVPLKPGAQETVSIDFIRAKDRQYLDRLAESFRKGGSLRVEYSLGVPLSGNVDSTAMHSFRADYTRGYRALRYGVGATYGFATGDVHLVEGYGIIAAQLTDVGGLPIHLGHALALVPYLSLDVGLGYHGLLSKSSGSRGDFGNFAESHLLLRGSIGSFLALNDQFAMCLEGSYGFTMDRPLSMMLGVLIHFGS